MLIGVLACLVRNAKRKKTATCTSVKQKCDRTQGLDVEVSFEITDLNGTPRNTLPIQKEKKEKKNPRNEFHFAHCVHFDCRIVATGMLCTV